MSSRLGHMGILVILFVLVAASCAGRGRSSEIIGDSFDNSSDDPINHYPVNDLANSRDFGIDYDHPFAYAYLPPDEARSTLAENWSLLFDGQHERLPDEGEGVLVVVLQDSPGCRDDIAIDGPVGGIVNVKRTRGEFEGGCSDIALIRTVALRIPAEKLTDASQKLVEVRVNGEANGLEFELE